MHALPRSQPTPITRSAEIVPFEELNRARTLRALARDTGPPPEPHPWAYAFPRPPVGENDEAGATGVVPGEHPS